ncbi:SRPBCC family protein [Altererythrobacter aquiaggeris]|uniref:SRPBCC family protein n=1 Tax=Aestuarierythrobacter aquiaggeris TaxID=1898396 RepID=UPI003018898F
MKRLFVSAALCIAALSVHPAAAEVVESNERGFVTRDTATTTATPFETWLQLIAPNKWWSDSHSWSADAGNMYLSAQGGGCFCELLPPPKDAPEGVRRGSVEHMRVLQADPPRVLRMAGGLGPLQNEPMAGVLTITLKPVGTGTRVLFEYVVSGFSRYETDVISKAVDGVMSEQLQRLVASLGVANDAGSSDDADKPAPGDGQPSGKASTKEKSSPLDSEDFLVKSSE